MRWLALSMLFLSACGGTASSSSVGWAGKWKQPVGFPAGSYVEATLSGSGATLNGYGVQHREAGPDQSFTVEGTTALFKLNYGGGSVETFYFAQPDPDHLVWNNIERTVKLVRQ